MMTVEAPRACFAHLSDAELDEKVRALKPAAFNPYGDRDDGLAYDHLCKERLSRWVARVVPHRIRKGA